MGRFPYERMGAGECESVRNVGRDVLFGSSIRFQTAAFIFVLEKHGMQVWYEHKVLPQRVLLWRISVPRYRSEVGGEGGTEIF
jgi:hypothetical protein